jgi:hypothetical protein
MARPGRVTVEMARLERQTTASDVGDGTGAHRMALANHPSLEEYDLSSLRYIMWGAVPGVRKRGGRRDGTDRGALVAGVWRQ